MDLFKVITSLGFLCITSKFLSEATGPNCITSCAEKPTGFYQSCKGCDVYVSCVWGVMYDNRPCPVGLRWDDHMKSCRRKSSTCGEVPIDTDNCVSSCKGKADGDYQSCFGCKEYATCSNGILYDRRPCPLLDLVWDDNVKRCERRSTTCPNVTCKDCCVGGDLNINLNSFNPLSDAVSGSLPGVEFLLNVTSPNDNTACSRSAVISVDFEKLKKNTPCGVNECFGSPPFCGQRLLKIEMQLTNGFREPGKRMFVVGDSITNDGFGGDSNTQLNDAEVDSIHPNVYIYPRDLCPNAIPNKPLFEVNDVTSDHFTKVNLYIGNRYLRIISEAPNQPNKEYRVCDDCLFALDGQPDSGGKNERLFVAFNNIIQQPVQNNRKGNGVCNAKITWACNFF